MTRRILAGFLGLLIGVLALIVVPLGADLSAQHRRDFQDAVNGTAASLAAVAEERLGDRADPKDRGLITLQAHPGDTVILLDDRGNVLVAEGAHATQAAIRAVRAGRAPEVVDTVTAVATVGPKAHPEGRLVLVRAAEPLDRRIERLWAGLSAAAALALAVGALVAVGLARWIARPLRDLRGAAMRMGGGDITARAGGTNGPPEVRELSRAFDEMAARIGSLLDSHRIMTLDVSHQLRTPLAALRLRLELLADDVPGDLRSELHGALREIGRLTRLADGLLAVARAEEMVTHPESVDVRGIVEERVELWEPASKECGVTLTTAVGPARAWATPGHLDQVLDNLLANALEALGPGNHIAVTARVADGSVVISVADDGPGLTQPQRDAAFNRFVSGRSQPSSSGLGLAIVARLVAADHGSAELHETPGGGLTAVVRLPSGRPR
ncbi:MAG TPA: HAMP domain-containing sensor histidine kinase [Mycobacteriales bacterium]|nr:HAMP domain-containing sensor histidine kinase [Mycobacteriales bacterium]